MCVSGVYVSVSADVCVQGVLDPHQRELFLAHALNNLAQRGVAWNAVQRAVHRERYSIHMDELKRGQTEWKRGRMERDGPTDGGTSRTDGQTERQTERQTDKQTDRQTDRQTDGQRENRQTGRQIDR